MVQTIGGREKIYGGGGGGGIVSEGNVHILATYPANFRSEQITQSGNQAYAEYWNFYIRPDRMTEDPSNLVVRMQSYVLPGIDQAVDAEIYNQTSGNTVIAVTGVTDDFETAWQDYTDPTDSLQNLMLYGATSPGDNNSELRGFNVQFGVKI